jgi:hypothetical protein
MLKLAHAVAVPCLRMDQRNTAIMIQNLNWTPDGAKITFTYQDRLFALMVRQ